MEKVTAKGGHVIIKEGYNSDQYDTALANFTGSFFPGRANKVVGRAHLANVNRAATKGYSYRLLENGFISNHEDLNKFNSQIDDLARGILKAFGITSAALVASVKKTEPVDGEIKSGGVFQSKTDKFGTISYQAHMRGLGWGNWQSDGLMVGSISSTKNDKIRVIPLTDDMARVLRKVKEFEFKNGWLGEYVFQDDRGRVYASRISDCAVNNTTTAEFHNKKSIHAIRRTLNSNMKCAGVSGTVAASLLGHTEKVNEENYTYDVSSMEEKSKFMECAGRV